MTYRRNGQLVLATVVVLMVAGCEEGSNPFTSSDGSNNITGPQSTSVELVARDVESPDVFQVTEDGLWDGRPSLGGVWVAHPSAVDPERVIIRNEDNGKFVIGALFRREIENPGPRLQVSSDAASALGMLAGSPSNLSVTALRREEVAVEPEAEAAPVLDAPEQIDQAPLDPITASAAAAIDAAETATTAPSAAAAPVVATAPAPVSSVAKPFVQLGLFSVEANANRTADLMRKEGVVPSVNKLASNGKTYWRVVVGPATSNSSKKSLLKKVTSLGFTDAYFVSS